jgi:hypothetical protein
VENELDGIILIGSEVESAARKMMVALLLQAYLVCLHWGKPRDRGQIAMATMVRSITRMGRKR